MKYHNIDLDTNLDPSNEYIDKLDECLFVALASPRKLRSLGNILISGLTGCGKTASVKYWSQKREVYVIRIDFDVYRVILDLSELTTIEYLIYEDIKEELFHPNCVLFFDQVKNEDRATAMEVLDYVEARLEKECSDEYKNILFFIEAVTEG